MQRAGDRSASLYSKPDSQIPPRWSCLVHSWLVDFQEIPLQFAGNAPVGVRLCITLSSLEDQNQWSVWLDHTKPFTGLCRIIEQWPSECWSGSWQIQEAGLLSDPNLILQTWKFPESVLYESILKDRRSQSLMPRDSGSRDRAFLQIRACRCKHCLSLISARMSVCQKVLSKFTVTSPNLIIVPHISLFWNTPVDTQVYFTIPRLLIKSS